MSLASEDMSVMNSTQHSIRRSRASLANVRPVLEGRISVMIFWTVAVFDQALSQHDATQMYMSMHWILVVVGDRMIRTSP